MDKPSVAELSATASVDVAPRADGGRRWTKLPILPIAIILLVLVIPALFAEVIAPHDPLAGGLRIRLQPPAFMGGTSEHILGTDRAGRDIFSRIIYGSRISLTIAALGIFFGGAVGVTLGLIAGYVGGLVDNLIMGLVNMTLSLPAILIALVLATVYGPQFTSIIVVIAFSLWAVYARQVRGEVLSLRERDFVARSRVAGASHLRIVLRHILPNVFNTLIVVATLQVGFVIIFEASMSFLGVGIPRPNPAWGLMVAEGRDVIFSAWWVSLFPGLAIMLTVLALNLLGDWLRDRLDPKRRHM